MVATPVSLFYCPSREQLRLIRWAFERIPIWISQKLLAKRTMPAILATMRTRVVGTDEGPKTLAEAATYGWKFSGDKFIAQQRTTYNNPSFTGLTGVIFQRSEIKIKQITDGTTHTYLLGEKNIAADHYEDGGVPNDDQSMYNGYDKDNLRSTFMWYPGFEEKGAPQMPGRARLSGKDLLRVEFRWAAPGRLGWLCFAMVRCVP